MIEIREAREGDLDDVFRLNVELHEYSAGGVPSRLRAAERYDDDARRTYAAKILADERSAFLIAVDAGESIGYAEVHIREPEQDPGVVPTRRGYVQALAVTTDRRREGVGAALLAGAERWARDRGAQEMELDHWIFDGDPAGFYERAGYEALSRMLVKKL